MDKKELRRQIREQKRAMSEEQINAFVQDTVKRLGITNPTKADKGKIMKELSAIRGKADMKVVAQLVSAILQ